MRRNRLLAFILAPPDARMTNAEGQVMGLTGRMTRVEHHGALDVDRQSSRRLLFCQQCWARRFDEGCESQACAHSLQCM